MRTLEYQVDSMPANADAERSILGAIMLEPKAYDEAAGLGLASADLSLDSHRRIYAAMQSVAESGRPIDTVTLSAELDGRRELDGVGGYAYIADLVTGIPDRPSIRHYVKIVQEKAALRKLILACNATIGSIGGGCSSQTAMEELGERILQVQTGSDAVPAQRQRSALFPSLIRYTASGSNWPRATAISSGCLRASNRWMSPRQAFAKANSG